MVDNGLWQGALRGGGGGKRTDVLGSKTGKKAPAVHLSPARRQKIRIEQKLEEHRRRRIGRALRRHEVRQQRLAPPHDNAVPTEDVAVVYTLGDARSRSCPPVVASYGDGVAAAGGRPLDLRAVVSRTRQLRTKWSQYQEPASRMPVLGDPDAADGDSINGDGVGGAGAAVSELRTQQQQPNEPPSPARARPWILTEEVDNVVAMAEAVRQEHVTLDGYRVHLHRFDPPLGVADDAEVSPEMLGGTTVLGTKLLLRRESHKARRLMELEEMLGTLKTNALEIMSTIRQTRHELESLRARARLPGWRDVPKEVLMASFQQASYYVLRQDANRQRVFSIPELVALVAADTSPEVSWLADAFPTELENGEWEELVRGIFAAIYAEQRRKKSLLISTETDNTGYQITRKRHEYFVMFDDEMEKNAWARKHSDSLTTQHEFMDTTLLGSTLGQDGGPRFDPTGRLILPALEELSKWAA